MQQYVDEENLPTEHAKLDDNGDGRGSEIQEPYLAPELGGRAGKGPEPKLGPRDDGALSSKIILGPLATPKEKEKEASKEKEKPKAKEYRQGEVTWASPELVAGDAVVRPWEIDMPDHPDHRRALESAPRSHGGTSLQHPRSRTRPWPTSGFEVHERTPWRVTG